MFIAFTLCYSGQSLVPEQTHEKKEAERQS